MSYSRWSSSIWYTIWCTSDAKKKEDEIFDVVSEASFTYKQLKEDMASCIDKAVGDRCDITALEKAELKSYMEQFLLDVDEDYGSARKP
jgi:hypothetical protein